MSMRTFVLWIVLLCSTASVSSADPFVIGGWDASRGNGSSIEDGFMLATARGLLATQFPDASLTSFGNLTAASLTNVDIVMISSVRANDESIIPLTAAEQSALFDFVLAEARIA